MCCILTNLVKFILVVINLIFVVGGIALLAIGVATLIGLSDILDIIPININAIPITIIVAGCIIFTVAFCGCWGAIKSSKSLLILYAVSLCVLAGGKIYLATEIFRGLSNIAETVERWLTDAFDATGSEPFHLLEIAFRCCGTTGPASYSGTLPTSCCRDVPMGATQCLINDAFTDGCVDILGSYFETFGGAIGGIVIAIVVFELVAASLGLFICCAGKSKQK